jgi:hypothetical protein
MSLSFLQPKSGNPPATQREERISLPLGKRDFLTGTTPSVDRSQNPAAAFVLSKEVGKVVMFWVTPNGTGLYEKISQVNPVAGVTNYEVVRRMGLVPIVTLNPWTARPGKGVVRNDGSASDDFSDARFVSQLCREVRQTAARFHPEYLSIGNEVNTVYEAKGERAFNGLVSLEKSLYRAVKETSPTTKVVVVLSYSQLRDLPGAPRFHLISALEDSYDVLGITTYPWKEYATAEELPADYYARLASYTRKPIGFTEIAWSSDPTQGGSEQKQVDYLLRFLELTKGLKMEFVNWAFLHDLPPSSVTGYVVQRSHLGLGLRKYDGTPKKVWHHFRALAQLPGP